MHGLCQEFLANQPLGSRGSDTFIKSLIFHKPLPFCRTLPGLACAHILHVTSKRVIFNLINVMLALYNNACCITLRQEMQAATCIRSRFQPNLIFFPFVQNYLQLRGNQKDFKYQLHHRLSKFEVPVVVNLKHIFELFGLYTT